VCSQFLCTAILKKFGKIAPAGYFREGGLSNLLK
jgi:hypothetical protein